MKIYKKKGNIMRKSVLENELQIVYEKDDAKVTIKYEKINY